MAKSPTRRAFLRTAPLAAACLPLCGKLLTAQTQASPSASPLPFQLFTADKLNEAERKLSIAPGNDNLFTTSPLPFTIVLTTEQKKAAKEFEWHEGRDHILQVLEGSTTYEIGGIPKNGRNTRPSEWLAPASAGATTLTLHKGDMLVIPRGTPHKRITETNVTFYLISTIGATS